MSNYALLNSPNPPFQYKIENANPTILIGADATGSLIPITAIQTSAGGIQTLTIPAGAYNIQMIATLGTAVADTVVSSAYLALFNATSGTIITCSQSCIYMGGNNPTNSFANINHTERIVFTSETTVRLVLFYTNANENFNIITNTDFDGYNQNARLIVNQTF